MAKKPSYEELEQRIKELEQESIVHNRKYQDLQESDEKYRAILEGIEDGYYEVDLNGNLTFFNDSLCRIYGYTRDELMGMNNREYMTPETAKRTYQIFNRVYTTGEPAKIFDWEFIGKDGTKVYVEISVSLKRDSQGQTVGFRGVVRDITARKRAEEALREAQADLERRVKARTVELVRANEKLNREIEVREQAEKQLKKSEEMYRLLAENVTDVIWTIDADQRITYVSPSVKDLLGYSVEESLGQNMKNTMTEASRRLYEEISRKIEKRLLDNGRKPFDLPAMEFEMIRCDGTTVWIEAGVTFLTDQEGRAIGLLGVTRNITERKKVEEELKQAKAEAEAANIAKSDFLANMSHEIRTPMNSVTGFTDMLLETDLDEEQVDYAKLIQSSGIALLSLIDDILDFSKIEAGRMDFEETDFDIELLAYDVCEIIRPRIGLKPIELLCHIGDNIPSKLNGDPHRIRQVLTNLMGNAAKFTDAGEIELSLDVDEEKDNRIKIHAMIRDTGIAIPKDKLSVIFMPFRQADSSTTRKFGGTGLGLSICKKISNLMDGDVWAESEVGRGSIFHFTAWLEKAEDKKTKRFTPVSLSGKRCLVVDDNQTSLDILTHTLGRARIHVVAIKTPKEVMKTLQEARKAGNPFDVCISDILMPEMNGYDLAKEIRDLKAHFSDLPLVALSSSSKRDAKRCQEAGFDGFLNKPCRREKLYKMIERIIGGRQGELEKSQLKGQRILTQYRLREEQKHSVHILLAEDNPVNQKLAEMMLTKAGYQVVVANNGLETVEKYVMSPEDFDLILMDIQMPEMDGIAATKAIRERGFDTTPIVAMTACAMKGDREKCLQAGMDDYIQKPIKREVVFQVLEKWVFDKNVS